MQDRLGPYEIERRLATGGMAEVYVARRVGPHGFSKRVALKKILPQYAKDQEFVAMFIEEARIAAQLEHPNIVQVFDFGEYSGQLFLAMEFVDGTNVNRLLRSVYLRKETVPLDCAVHIAGQTARALSHAHRAADEHGIPLRIVHRDVSPANILLTREGHVKLSDFGIVHIEAGDRYTGAGKVRGKPGYMSPEQVMGLELDPRSDVFTLATVFAEMLLARPLFGEGSELEVLLKIRNADLSVLEQAQIQLPVDVKQLLKLGLALEPNDRPTAAEFADALEAIARRRKQHTKAREHLVNLLHRLDLITHPSEDAQAAEPGARPTWLLHLERGASSTTGSATATAETALEPTFYRIEVDATGNFVEVNFAELVSLITRGLVHRDTRLARENSPYKPLHAFEELARFVGSPALGWEATRPESTTWHGELGRGNLFPLAHKLAKFRETGVLCLDDGTRKKKVYFVDGRPEFVASTDRKELFGEFLVNTGVCSRPDLRRALAILPKYEGRLGDALVAQGILKPGELFRAVLSQQRYRYLEAFRWQIGDWYYLRGVRSQQEIFPMSQDSYELIRDAVIEADAMEVEAAVSPISERVLKLAQQPPVPSGVFRLPPSWERVLESARTETTLTSMIARESLQGDLGPDEVCKVVLLGTSCELLEVA